MKTLRVILIIIAVLVYAPVLAGAAHAQAINLPDNAAGLIPWLVAFFSSAGFAAWVGSTLTEGIKKLTQKYPIFTPAGDPAITGLASKLLVAILVAAAGQLAVTFAPVAAYLDQTGLWAVVVAGVFAAQKFYLSEKAVKGVNLTAVLEETGSG